MLSHRPFHAVLRLLLSTSCLATCLAACGDDDEPPPPVDGGPADAGELDAGFDAGPRPPPRDSGIIDYPDAGPPPTGCELLGMDGGVGPGDDGGVLDDPAPDAHPPLAGPGGPSTTFDPAALLSACAYLDGGERDRDHHNTVAMFDGYLWMPWAHEGGIGGISSFDFHDACNPVAIGTTVAETMRETHAAGITTMNGGKWMVTTSLTGILFWDLSDPAAPRMVRDFTLPGVSYPDAYMRVVLSTFWQAPFVFVGAADNGVFVVDASDPENPELVTTYEPVPDLRVGGVHAIGTLLVVLSTEGTRTNLVDISDPRRPRAIPGGTYHVTDGTFDRFGRPNLKPAYFGHVNGNRTHHARNALGGGVVIFDITDFTAPSFLGNWNAPPIANGGYVFFKQNTAFVGLSNYGAAVDVSDPSAMEQLARIEMTGDLDTVVPIGNVLAVSVDDDAIADQATNVMPYETEPDTAPPAVNMIVPRDGATNVSLLARVGLTFDEFVELGTVFRGSFRVQKQGTTTPLEGTYSGQEGAVNFWPARPLEPATTYEVVVPAGGVTDVSGNPTTAEFRASFTTVSCD